ncbi:hypothetical protein B0H14DRAFT_3477154 [Mycena olivaceomarginata]|nr:hypothetical protein B0H14DRAFT_3477154 [Mycena olivaceomarginata]
MVLHNKGVRAAPEPTAAATTIVWPTIMPSMARAGLLGLVFFWSTVRTWWNTSAGAAPARNAREVGGGERWGTDERDGRRGRGGGGDASGRKEKGACGAMRLELEIKLKSATFEEKGTEKNHALDAPFFFDSPLSSLRPIATLLRIPYLADVTRE